jgi:hypothetical protein
MKKNKLFYNKIIQLKIAKGSDSNFCVGYKGGHSVLTQLLYRIGIAYEEIRKMRTIIVQLVADLYPTAVDPQLPLLSLVSML